MEGHARTWFTPKQKAELWERWKRGQCVAKLGSCRCGLPEFYGRMIRRGLAEN